MIRLGDGSLLHYVSPEHSRTIVRYVELDKQSAVLHILDSGLRTTTTGDTGILLMSRLVEGFDQLLALCAGGDKAFEVQRRPTDSVACDDGPLTIYYNHPNRVFFLPLSQ